MRILPAAGLGLLGVAAGALLDRRPSAVRPEPDNSLRASTDFLNSLSEIINNAKDVESLMYFSLREALSIPALKGGGAAAFIGEGGSNFKIAAKIGMDDSIQLSECTAKCGCPSCGKAFQTGEPVTSLEHGRVRVSLPLSGPLSGAQGRLGVICIYPPVGQGVSKADLALLRAASNLLSLAAGNLRLAKATENAQEGLSESNIVLMRKVQKLNSLVEVDKVILSTLDRDEMLYKVGVQIRQLVPADVGGVALTDAETGDYRYIGGWGMEIKNREILHNAGWLGGSRIYQGKPLVRKNIEEEAILSPFDRMLSEAGVKSDVCAPIMRKGGMVGVFFVGSFRDGSFSSDDVETVTAFAARMGIALEHARLIYDLDEMSVSIIHALSSAIDAKSSWTKGHSERVSDYALAIAEKMGLGKRDIERLRLAGLLHDIGKIGTYDILLDKTGRLTEEEWQLIKLHPDRGCEILAPITEFKDILPAVKYHHERWDGKGYPLGLKGEEIPVMAQIICIADSFDTMTADRPYRPAIGLQNAIQEITYCSGTQFSPNVSDVFLNLIFERGMDIGRNAASQQSARPVWGNS
ncbi:MAG TPA: HD domain-containing phosphohydrolase [Nitrospirota bacterium]|jgi:putative nucleotidyltransferase with HDIG domain